MTMHTLVPERDVRFKSTPPGDDSQTKNHLHSSDGETIVDPTQSKPFASVGLRVFGSTQKIEEILSSMEEAVLLGDWERFKTHVDDLKFLKQGHRLTPFCKTQMELTASRDCSDSELETIRQKFILIEIDEDELERGYQEGLKKLQPLYLPGTRAHALQTLLTVQQN